MSSETTVELDLRGLRCPLLLVKTKQILQQLPWGTTLVVHTTDASSEKDFKRYTQLAGHEFLNVATEENSFKFMLRKGAEK